MHVSSGRPYRRLRSSIFPLAFALAGAAVFCPLPARAQIDISVQIAPPELPVYEQPVIPGDGYLWTPGYWAYADGDYYWVPGTWVQPPQPEFLWTPPFWGFLNGAYVFHAGYWGPQVGFYGGINYGFGYSGDGYYGGRWDHGHFDYNTTVNNVNTTIIHNTYRETVNNVTVTRVSYNGGTGGIRATPTPQQEEAARVAHVAPTSAQVEHQQMASRQPDLHFAQNHGRPAITATAKPAAFTRPAAAPEAAHPEARPPAAETAHPEARPAAAPEEHRPAAPVTRAAAPAAHPPAAEHPVERPAQEPRRVAPAPVAHAPAPARPPAEAHPPAAPAHPPAAEHPAAPPAAHAEPPHEEKKPDDK